MREHFNRGQEAYEHRQFDVAASEFRAAYSVKPAAALLYNEAMCYVRIDDRTRAVALLERYLTEAPQARDRDAVLGKIKDLRGSGPVVTATRGVVYIDSTPPGATIYLDDKSGPPLGTTPWNGTLEGAHTVILALADHQDLPGKVAALPGAVQSLQFILGTQPFLGFLQVSANVPGSEVYIDDRAHGSAGRTPFYSQITPGKHVVYVNREGFTWETRELDVTGGKAYEIAAKLEPAPIGFVDVLGATTEGAVVKLDGAEVCRAPCRFPSPSGAHRVTVEKDGKKTFATRLAVGMATETRLAVRLAARPSRTDLIWKFGFAAAALGGGTYLGLQALSVRHDLERDMAAAMPPLPADDPRYSKGRWLSLASDGLLLVGGVVAAYGIVSIFVEPGPASSGEAVPRALVPGVSIAPQVGPGYGGLGATLTF